MEQHASGDEGRDERDDGEVREEVGELADGRAVRFFSWAGEGA